MGDEGHQLHIMFLPFMAHGHMIPIVDMAKLFALRGAKATIVITPVNATLFDKTFQRIKDLGLEIHIKIIRFPSAEVGLPEGFENADSIASPDKDVEVLIQKFFIATAMLQEPVEKLIQETRPDCFVADMFFPWATNAAAKFGVPRLVFHGSGFFPMCAAECIRLYEPHRKVSSDSEPFEVPNLPGHIEFTRKELSDHNRQNEDGSFGEVFKALRESELKAYGVVFNSFYELEPVYADYYRKVMGRKAWHIGPLSLCNRDIGDKARRVKEAAIDEHECLKWLDSKKPNSVIYVCFGTVAIFTAAQLKEIALGLEASRQQFIWVVRKDAKNERKEEWLPEGFEERMEGKGLIIHGWAPQILILDHEAIGGFVNHCGWNSILEGIAAGKPMVAWPVCAEQFYNAKLVTHVLKTGVEVGVQEWVKFYGDYVKSEAIEKALARIMMGEEAEEIRSRAKDFGETARKAVQEGGSSYSDLTALMQELKGRRC